MSLPEEVLRLLGDDATPEKALVDFDFEADWKSGKATDFGDDPQCAYEAWMNALSAAAIRLAEATSADVEREGLDGGERWLKALAEYRAIRNWKKP